MVIAAGQAYLSGGYRYDSTRERLVLFSDVQFASLSELDRPDGHWRQSIPFHRARTGHGSVAHGEHIYVIGGGDGLNFFDDVQRASVGPDGQIVDAGWRVETNTLVIPRAAISCGVFRTSEQVFIYVAGGATYADGRIEHLDSVEFARINDDGSVGPWTLSPHRFLEGRAHCGLAIVDEELHIVGGWGDFDLFAAPSTPRFTRMDLSDRGRREGRHSTSRASAMQRSCVRVRLARPCSRSGEYSPPAATQHSAIRGQAMQTTPTRRATRFPAWVPLPPSCDFHPPRWGHSGIAHDGSMYVIGGHSGDGVFLTDVLRVRPGGG